RRTQPTPKALRVFGERWKPYRSVAAWYLWRAGGRRAAEDEVAGKHIATLPLAGEACNERPFRTSQEAAMELYEVMRTTFAAREFTDEPVPDAVLFKILDHARFAPNGGNRQGWRVIVVRDPATRKALSDCAAPAAKRYAAQVQAGESPWNTIDPTRVDAVTIERTPPPARLTEPFVKAPVVLVVCVDLKVV